MTLVEAPRGTVVIVDDDKDFGEPYVHRSRRGGPFEYVAKTTVDSAMDYLRSPQKTEIQAFLVDLELDNGHSGTDFIQRARPFYPSVPFIICSNYSAEDLPNLKTNHPILLENIAIEACFIDKQHVTDFGILNERVASVILSFETQLSAGFSSKISRALAEVEFALSRLTAIRRHVEAPVAMRKDGTLVPPEASVAYHLIVDAEDRLRDMLRHKALPRGSRNISDAVATLFETEIADAIDAAVANDLRALAIPNGRARDTLEARLKAKLEAPKILKSAKKQAAIADFLTDLVELLLMSGRGEAAWMIANASWQSAQAKWFDYPRIVICGALVSVLSEKGRRDLAEQVASSLIKDTTSRLDVTEVNELARTLFADIDCRAGRRVK